MSKKFLSLINGTPQNFKIWAKSATKAEINIYGTIGQDWFGDGITAKSFSDELNKLDASVNEIDIRINSPGGDVFDGITIYNRLIQHKAKITVHIDGLAASIASIIALAGDEVIMGEGALYMVHLPWTFAFGNREDLDKTVGTLMDIEEQMVSIYAKKSGLGRTEIKKLLEDETWLDADQAIAKGFVDKKAEESQPIAASAMQSKWFLKKPTTFKSDTDEIVAGISDISKKIGERLARK